jgi:crotonobetainyl-CoA:carnitine CoA-transferase CaiB-like acyl-CoA transferase
MDLQGPLTGLRLLEAGSIFSGPLIGAHLGDLGAEVIKVEPPRGDDTRRLGSSKNGIPLWWKLIARNKRLVSVNLATVQGAEVFRRLTADVDIVVENFRAGKFAEWGLDYESLSARNPRLIMLHISGYGSSGPYKDFPGFGTLAEAFAGFVHMNGQPDGPPTLPSFPIADTLTALFGCYSVLAAVIERQKSGVGQEIELDLCESIMSLMGNMFINFDQLGEVMKRRGNTSAISVPRNAYQTLDEKWVVVSSSTAGTARRLFQAIGRIDLANDPELQTNRQRMGRAAEIDSLVAKWMLLHTRDTALAILRDHDVAAAPINSVADVANDPHVIQRNSLIDVMDEDLGNIKMQGVVPRFSRTPGKVHWAGKNSIGADTSCVLRDAGYSSEEISELERQNVIISAASNVPQ